MIFSGCTQSFGVSITSPRLVVFRKGAKMGIGDNPKQCPRWPLFLLIQDRYATRR